MRGFALTLALVCMLGGTSARAQVRHAVGQESASGNRPATVGEGLLIPVRYEQVEPAAAAPASESSVESDTAADEANALELPQRSESHTRLDSPGGKGPAGALGTVMGGLAIVIGLFLLVVWVTRKTGPRGTQALPGEVVEVLGRAPLPGKQHMQLLRVGRKLVLVCTTATGMETLTEITEPDEVDRLTALCQQKSPNSVSSTFRQVLTNLDEEPAKKGRLGREARALARSRQQVFQGSGSNWEGGDA